MTEIKHPELSNEPEEILAVEEEPTVELPHFWTVALYLVDQQYGGPEEGGWWYDVGQRVDNYTFGSIEMATPVICADEFDADDICRAKNDYWLSLLNRNRPHISSVLSRGQYRWGAHQGYPPANWPNQRPTYS